MDEFLKFKVTNRATGTVFYAEPGETLLTAARRHDVHLNYSCLKGRCSSCQATVVAGDWHYPYFPAEALTAAQSDAGEALLCQAVPLSDITLVAREPAALKRVVTRQMNVTLTRLDFPAVDVARMALVPHGPRPDYLAGQYLDFILADGKRRAFSIANAPGSSDFFEVHARQVPGGGFTDQIFHGLAVGDQLRVEAPLGTFFWRDRSPRPMLCVAGGTGFAPIKAIVEQTIADRCRRPLTIYWGARTGDELYLDQLARKWAADHEHIEYVPVVSDDPHYDGRYGLVHDAVIADHDDLVPFDVYMSGPPALVAAGRAAFATHGLPTTHLYFDSFEFAPDIRAKLEDSTQPPDS